MTRRPVNGNRHFDGRLESLREGRLTLDLSVARRKHDSKQDVEQKVEIELGNVEKASLVPEI
jgi:ribosome maturation factor RimP